MVEGECMRVLMTGGTGVIGGAVGKRLVASGHELVILTRNPERAKAGSPMLAAARCFRWNPEEAPPPSEAFAGVDAVIHLAGEPVAAGRWTEEQKRRIRDSRVLGTRHLIEGMAAVKEAKPLQLIAASAVGFYGDRGDELLDETSQPGTSYLSEVCQEWEEESRCASLGGTRVVLLRIGVVLSPTGGALEKMLLPFKLGLGGRLGNGRQWFPWIHLADIVGLIEFALANPTLAGPVNGVAPGIVTNEAFTRILAATLHRPVFLPVPEFALRLMTGEMAAVVLASQRVTPAAALAAGYAFRFPTLESALRDLLVGKG
jgi:uncharacterized protein (TIGR01777 family)